MVDAGTIGGLIGGQISEWLAAHPAISIGLGIGGLALVDTLTGGKIYNTALKAYDFLRDYLVQAYDVVKTALGYLTGFVSFVVQTFTVDDPKKTLYLSLVFFAMILGVILVFSGQSWGAGGITEMEKKDFSLGDFSGIGAIGSAPQAGNLPDVTTTTLNPENPPPDLNYTWVNVCYTDADCDRVYGEHTNSGYRCCNPSTYAGYTCQGQCLKYQHGDYSLCKHPAACYNVNVDHAGLVDRILTDSTGCLGKAPTANNYCRSSGDQSAKCCDTYPDSSNVCYGYCTRANTSDNCADYTQCLEEFEGI